MVSYQIKISGKVQGVWFRQSTRQKALELGIIGFARNEGDGSVYVEAHAPEEILGQFVDWCRHGPPLAEVRNISAHPFSSEEQYDGFEIRK